MNLPADLPTRTKLSINLRFLRIYSTDKPRSEVARFLRVTEGDIKLFETNQKTPTIEQIYMLATYYRIEVIHLLEVDLVELSVKARLMRVTWRSALLKEVIEVTHKTKTISQLKEQNKLKDQIIQQLKDQIQDLKKTLDLKEVISTIVQFKL